MKRKRRYYKGKRISKGEEVIARFLDSHNLAYEREKTFRDCVNQAGNLLRFDFYLERYNVLIEYQGPHHIRPINKYKRALNVHKKTKIHDEIKKTFALKNEINLIEIFYTDFSKLENILTNLIMEFDYDTIC
jgi:hypothetical protein